MPSKISRRNVLKSAAAASGVALAPQASAQQAGGRRFRAFVRHGTGTSVEELRLLPIQPREVVIRTQASAVCYTITGQVLGMGALGTNQAQRWSIPNHSGMGVVEEIGAQVK